MSIPNEHHLTVFACGHVHSQCRCPGPKTKRVLPESCPGCSAQNLEAKVHGRSHNELVRLAAYLTQQHGAAPQGQEGAVDVAIRLLRQTADLERTLSVTAKALERERESLGMVHELHGDAQQALGALAAALAATVSITSAIDDVFERAAELDRMGEEVLAGTTGAHLKGCPDQPRVEYSRPEVRVSPRDAAYAKEDEATLKCEGAEEQP